MPAFDPQAFSDAFDLGIDASVVVIDHASAAIGRMPQQFKTKPKVQSLLRCLLSPMAALETAITDLATKRNLETAEGEQLSVLGRIVGQGPIDLDQELFRALVGARVFANRSSGTGNEILRIARLVLGRYAASVSSSGLMSLLALPDGMAAYRLKVRNIDLTYELARVLMDHFLRDSATAAGVRAILEFQPFEDGEGTDNHTRAFNFSDGPGLGFGSLPQLDLAPLTANVNTIVRHRDSRVPTLSLIADGSGAGLLTSLADAWTFHFESGVTTVAQFETAVSASSALVVLVSDGVGTMTSPGDVLAETSFTKPVNGGHLVAALE